MATCSGGPISRDLSGDQISNLLQDSDSGDDFCCEGDSEEDLDYTLEEEDGESLVCDSESDSTSDDDARPRQPAKRARQNQQNSNEWQWTNSSTNIRIEKCPFTGNPGVNRGIAQMLSDKPSEYEVYKTVFPRCFWQSVSNETNRYAAVCILEKPDNCWFDTTVDEIEGYSALCILMSQVRKSDLTSYWSVNEITATPFFSEAMPRKRFFQISKYLHFANNEALDKNDKISKLRPVVDFFCARFPELYNSEEDVSLDESLMKCRGRVGYIQFNRTKRARFGIKFYKLCESSSGYCFSFSIYTGKTNTPSDLPVSEAIVLKMIEPYESDGHTVYLDNWYSSPNLYQKLHEKGTNAVGTVNIKRKNMPADFKSKKKMKKGEVETRFSHDMMALKWMDKKSVSMLSTVHQGADMVKTGKIRRSDNQEIEKPRVVIDYNRGMGGVDRHDQQLASFPIMRRYKKVYKKIFFYILDMALYNSYVLFKKISKIKRLRFDAYRLTIVEQLFGALTLPAYPKRGRPAVGESPLRIQPRNHFPRYIPPNAIKQALTRKCKVCYERKKRSESRWECKTCLVALHVPECFEIYHTKVSME